ncbi:MAG: NUDIX domain-containing protein [Labilithrix sp.]|nr:NUDIX domain-containing protein [Labilithrix sp.]MCW5810299.1 NUDIX domain-containing protein [Labilithrix sp.]
MIPLDRAGLHVLVVRGDGEVAVEYRGGDRVSAAEQALSSALRVHGASVGLALEDGSVLEVAERAGAGGALRSRYRLCPFELRYAADHGRLHPVPLAARGDESVVTPITDLHTHYAGCVGAEDLLAIGRAHDVAYPPALLAEAGVRIEVEGERAVPIAELPDGARARLARALAAPADRRITFLDMERIYRLRAPITKSLPAMPAILRRLAEDYAAMGIRYVELSLGSLALARVLRTIHEHVPAIEDETGVTLRFLLALSRHDDPEWDEDLLRRLATLGESLYVAGIDVMGHETNSTHAFVPQLRAAATWATRERPGFVVRVHAGESPSHPENLRVAIEALAGFAVATRLGHGLYGADDETLSLVVESRATVEMNLDSNVALNHLASGRDAPLRRYLDAGARVTLGSDGYGIYGASAESAARAALVSGVRPADLAGPMRAVEEEVIAAARERDRPARRAFAVPDDLAPVAFTDEVVRRRREAIAARDHALAERLAALSVPVLDRASFLAFAEGRHVVSIAGAWKHSWDAMSEGDRARVEMELAAFVDALDVARVLLLTGGTRFGVEGLVGARARGRGIPVVGAIVSETEPASLASEAMTHAHVVAATLYEKCARLYELVDATGGACVFAGGGQIVRDEIQAAKNLGLPYVALSGPGASGAHARERPAAAVHTGAEIAYFVGARPSSARVAPHWFEGPNPTVDAIVLRRGSEVLLVRRSVDAPVEPSAWALPGGFVRTDAPRGGAWRAGVETDVEACVRELREETALAVSPERLRRVGVFEGNGRDPRDGARSFSRTTAFLVALDDEEGRVAIAGGDDADDARWFPLDSLPARLAFDHAAILAAALKLP